VSFDDQVTADNPAGDTDALARLRADVEEVQSLPVEERAARFEAVNAALTDELGRLDEV
jgi:hypothetical protein